MTLSSASPGFGSIYGTDLAVLLRSRGIDTIILGGINTNASVDATAREARGARVPGQWQRSRQGGEGCLPSSRNGDGSSARMGWHLMPGAEQRALPWAVPRHKTEPGIRPDARCAGWPRAGTMMR